jgi:S-adenosylmethionine:tRNA ribosyltransferase-isomerase
VKANKPFMTDPQNIRIEDYDYPLPAELIAQYPLEKRDASRLLFYNKGLIEEQKFKNLPELLPSPALLVFNDTRVIRARFNFQKSSRAKIEIFCLEPIAPTADLQQAFAATDESHWKCYVGNLKKWKEGRLQLEISSNSIKLAVWAEKTGSEKDTVNIQFTWNNSSLSFSEAMEAAGHIPLPPYISREDEEADASRYQTIFAREQGSVAAPTAGLHFTEKVMASLARNRIATKWITLHVGAGTFKPVSAETISGHDMHHENYSVSRELILSLLESVANPVIPVGTTSMRTLESIYWLGVKLIKHGVPDEFHTGQWEPYKTDEESLSKEQALLALLDHMDKNGTNTLHASTGLLIAPGYRFRICNGLITNFHLPKSTLLLLVAALVGDNWRKAYTFALEKKFRFLSYGDSCLFLP